MIRMALIITILASPAFAGCGPRAVVLAELAGQWAEDRHAIGLASDGAVIELWANAETGSFTVTATSPEGVTCGVVAGGAFEAVAPKPGVPG